MATEHGGPYGAYSRGDERYGENRRLSPTTLPSGRSASRPRLYAVRRSDGQMSRRYPTRARAAADAKAAADADPSFAYEVVVIGR